jgi:hypothetical protein
VDVQDVVLGIAGLAPLGDGRSLDYRIAALDEERTEMGERDLVSTGGGDRHRAAVCRDLTGERNLPRRGGANGRRMAEGDIDAPMLSGCVRVVAERELAQHATVRRPCPRTGARCVAERPRCNERDSKRESRCLGSQHLSHGSGGFPRLQRS